MKKNSILYMLLFVLISTFANCKKTETPLTELGKLPPITQTGANTFGCLVDGVAWLPNGRKSDGWLGEPNIEVYINLNLNYRTFGIHAGKYNGINSMISFGTSKILQIGEYKFDFANIDNEVFFDYNKNTWGGSIVEYSIPYESLTYRKGKFVISKLDNIVSGTFEIELCKPNSTDTIRITNGRFDVKI
jgi:hypothetical protein